MMQVKINGEPFAHKFCTVDIFGEYYSLLSNITSCQSRVSARFCNSASNTDFYQMFLSQTAILHDVNEGKSYSVWSDLYQSQTTTQTHIH